MEKQELLDVLRRAREAGISVPKEEPLIGRMSIGFRTETKEGIYDQLIQILAKNPDLKCFDNRMFSMGNCAMRVSYGTLVRHLLLRTFEVGEAQAVEELERYNRLEFTPIQNVLVFSGVAIDKEVDLGRGIGLTPFDLVPDCSGKRLLAAQREALQAVPLYMPLRGGPMHSMAALTKKAKIQPKTFDADKGESFRSEGFDTQELYDVCDYLTLFGQSAPVVVGSWGTLENWIPCSALLDGGCGGGGDSLHSLTTYKFTEADYQSASASLNSYLGLVQDVRRVMRIALQRLNLARRRRTHVNRAIDLGIALETLVLHDRSREDPISYPFRLRGAWLLGKDSGERENYMSLFKDVYACRCEAVHAGTFSRRFTNKLSRPLNEVLEQGERLCVDIVLEILKRGTFPDWNRLVLG